MSVRGLLVCALSLLVFAPAAALAQDVRLSMSASSNRVRVGEPFAVEVRAEIRGGGGDEEVELPDFGKLELLGRRMSRPFSFSFGFGTGGQHAQVQSQIVYTFTLRALEPGSYRIPPAAITVNGRRFASRPLTIEASGNAMAPPSGFALQPPPASDRRAGVSPPDGELDGARFDRDMFVRTVVDKRRAYVGEQVTVTVYLYVRGGLRDTPTVTREPTNEGFWTHDLLPPQRSLSAVRQEVQGRVFSVYVLRRYAAFPMRAGKLQIGATAIETGGGGSLFDLLTGPAEPIRRIGVPVEVEVSELPARASKHPVHVGELGLEARLDPGSAKVGDAVTLQVTAKGLGNLRGLKLEAPQLSGVDVLQPEIKDNVTTDLDQVGGERVFTWLMLPREPGTYNIAPFAVDVLDPQSGTYTTVRSRELQLTITGTGTVASTQGPKPPSQPDEDIADEIPASFGPVRLESKLRRASRPVQTAPWYPWLLAAAPLSAALAFGGTWATRKRAALRQGRQTARDAMRAAQGQLADAREHLPGDPQAFLAAVSQALQKGLEAKIGEPVGGLTWSMLRQHLAVRGLPAGLVEQVVGKLEQLEQLRFIPMPKSSGELQRLSDEASAALRELAQAEVHT